MASVLVGQGSEFTVNTTFDAGQAVPSVKVLNNGNLLVTWNDEPTSSIQAQIITADGVKVGGEFQINEENAASQSQSNLQNSNITVLSNGQFVVTWIDNSKAPASGDSSGSAVKFRVFNQDGTPATDEALANTRTLDNQTAPTITSLAGDKFVIVWQDANKTAPADTDAAGSAVRAQIFNTDGTKSGGEFLVNSTVAGNQTAPFVTTLADGTFVVTWIDAAAGGDIKGQRYSAAGTALGSEFTIDADADADTIPVVTAVNDQSLATGNGNNNFVVAWVATGGSNVGADIHYKLFTYDTATGTQGGPAGDAFTAGAEQIVNSSTTGNQNSVTLLGTADGGWLVGFRDQNTAINGNSANAAFVQYDKTGAKLAWVDDTGTLVTSDRLASVEQHLEGDFGSKTVFPSLVQLPNGSIMMFYEERLGQGDDANDESIRGVTFKIYVLADGTGAVNALAGTAGKDSILIGRGGNDTLTGNTGNDILMGGAGADQLRGGAGNDTASYADAASGIVADLQFGDNTAAVTGFATTGDAVGDSYGSIENLTGSAFNDRLYGDAGANILTGGAGDDVLVGRGGADKLLGGDGHDTADYSSAGGSVTVDLTNGGSEGEAAGDTYNSIENVIGTSEDDTITGNADANILKGGAGNDILDGGADQNTDQLFDGDYLDGGAGNDTVTYEKSASGVIADLANGGSAALDGSAGDAQGDLYASIENLTGSNSDDRLSGNGGANVLTGNDGDDVLEGRAGADTLSGGEGSDTASYASAKAAVKASLTAPASNTGDAKGDTYASIENLTGSKFADTLTGNGSSNVIEGGAGADTINGAGGFDFASYEHSAAAVTISLTGAPGSGGDAAGDRLSNIEALVGSAFADKLTGNATNNWFDGGAGADTIDGGGGNDLVYYSGSSAGVTVDLTLAIQVSAGDASGDKLISIERVSGTDFADALLGNAAANVLYGQDGDDTLEGRGGADILAGGDGIDTASYEHAAAKVTANLDDSASNTGDAAGDSYDSIENLRGSAFNDTLTGNDEDNVIEGGAGADTLDGGDNEEGGDTVSYAHDTVGVTVNLSLATAQSGGHAQGDILSGFENVTGGSGNDTLTGDAGDNVLKGGFGADTLDGGAGADSFVYSLATEGGDTINNFAIATDSIILDYAPDAFNFSATMPDIVIGSAAITSAATFFYNQANGELRYDADGTGAGANVLLATIFDDAGTTAAQLTLANFQIRGVAGILVDD